MIINRVPAATGGNFNPGGNYDPGKDKGLFLHPYKQDFLTTAQLATPQTSIAAKLVTDTYTSRSHFIHDLIMPEFKGEAEGYENRDQLKYRSDKGTWEKWYTLNGTYADYQKAKKLLDGRAKQFKVIIVDDNNVIRHRQSATGIIGFRIHQMHVINITEATPGKAVTYQIRLALSDIEEVTTADHSALEFNPFTTLTAVEDVKLASIVSATAATFKFSITAVSGEENYADLYKGTGELKQTSAFSLVNAAGLVIGLTSISAILNGTETVGFALVTNTAANYVVGEKAYLKLTAPSVIAGYTGVPMESNILEITLT